MTMDREARRQLLIEIRQASGLSMEKFGARLGVSRQSVHAIETAKTSPAIDTLEAWLKQGRKSVHTLILDEGVAPASITALDEAATQLGAKDLDLVLRLARALPRTRAPLKALVEQILRVIEDVPG